MNLGDILEYGHQPVLKTVDGLPEKEWQRGGVCVVWSVKDISAQIALFTKRLT